MAGEIVVGYDGAGGSHAALREAVQLGSELKVPLVVVFAFQPPMVERQVADHREALLEYGTKQVQQAVEKAREGGVEAEGVVVDRRPADALIQVADERDGRMIMVGSCGEGRLKGALLGSTPHRLLQTTHRPVVVVPG
jgi:nucleotide-binding universal stress UspA family protein